MLCGSVRRSALNISNRKRREGVLIGMGGMKGEMSRTARKRGRRKTQH